MQTERRFVKSGKIDCPYLSAVLQRPVSGYSCAGCDFNRDYVGTFHELKESNGDGACVSCFYNSALLGAREAPEELNYLPQVPLPQPQKLPEPRKWVLALASR